MGFNTLNSDGGAYDAYVTAVSEARDASRVTTYAWFDEQLSALRGQSDPVLSGVAGAGELLRFHQDAPSVGGIALGGEGIQG